MPPAPLGMNSKALRAALAQELQKLFPKLHVKPDCSLIFSFKGFFVVAVVCVWLVGFYVFPEVQGPSGL